MRERRFKMTTEDRIEYLEFQVNFLELLTIVFGGTIIVMLANW